VPSPGSSIMVAVILLLLLAIGVVLFVMWRQQQAAKTTPQTPEARGPAEEIISDDRMVYGGQPRARSGAGGEAAVTVLKNLAYISGYSQSRRDPLWVCYRVWNNPQPYSLPRPTGGFLMDTRLAHPVKDSDYARSGYDRGHLAPNSAIARCYGPAAQLETFLLTNICPQTPALNEKVWERLEVAERGFGDTFEEVWVMDGPIFGDLNGGTTAKLASGIAVPSAFYKILVDEEGAGAATQGTRGMPRVFAVIMPQDVKGTELPQQYVTSIREIENQTHLEFLWKLDAATQEQLESKAWPMWSRSR